MHSTDPRPTGPAHTASRAQASSPVPACLPPPYASQPSHPSLRSRPSFPFLCSPPPGCCLLYTSPSPRDAHES
eukprot:4095606-Prymnesium_polylepis.1